MYGAALVGLNLKFSTPPGYEPNKDIVDDAKKTAETTKASINYHQSPEDAVKGAEVVYTDVWASMGKEDEHAKRMNDFKDYQVNEKLFAKAKKDAFFMHCLPVHRGEEVVNSVIDGPSSIVIDQAENRLHVQKALLVIYVGGKKRYDK